MKTVDIKNLTKSQALALVETGELVLHKNKLYTIEDFNEAIELQEKSDYNDMLQGVRKVLLNSTYGASLNEFCRFHDPRLGASTTGSGRQITTHMINTVSRCLMGDNAPKVIKTIGFDKKTGESINDYSVAVPSGIGPIYSDTDSCYFVMKNLVGDSIEDAIACADAVVSQINDSFPEFMRTAFLCQPGFDNLIKANREVVATAGIFRAKKKYILHVADMEGKRLDPADPKSLKSQGSDIKLSSTPETIRTLLKDVTMMILNGSERQLIDDYIINFRKNLHDNHNINPLDYATITSINNIDEYFIKWKTIEKPGLGKANLPANARSSINHNLCVEMFGDSDTRQIISGNKIKIVWLKPNDHGFLNMAFNSDTLNLPKWFTDNFSIDVKLTEKKLVDKKLENIFEPIGWSVPTVQTQLVAKLLDF